VCVREVEKKTAPFWFYDVFFTVCVVSYLVFFLFFLLLSLDLFNREIVFEMLNRRLEKDELFV